MSVVTWTDQQIDDITKAHRELVEKYQDMIVANEEAARKADQPELQGLIKTTRHDIERFRYDMESCKSSELGEYQGRIKQCRDLLQRYTQPHSDEKVRMALRELATFEHQHEMLLEELFSDPKYRQQIAKDSHLAQVPGPRQRKMQGEEVTISTEPVTG